MNLLFAGPILLLSLAAGAPNLHAASADEDLDCKSRSIWATQNGKGACVPTNCRPGEIAMRSTPAVQSGNASFECVPVTDDDGFVRAKAIVELVFHRVWESALKGSNKSVALVFKRLEPDDLFAYTSLPQNCLDAREGSTDCDPVYRIVITQELLTGGTSTSADGKQTKITGVQTEDELAGILGHEMMHAKLAHLWKAWRDFKALCRPWEKDNRKKLAAACGARRSCVEKACLQDGEYKGHRIEDLYNAVIRGHENEADAQSLEYLALAGYNTGGMRNYLTRTDFFLGAEGGDAQYDTPGTRARLIDACLKSGACAKSPNKPGGGAIEP